LLGGRITPGARLKISDLCQSMSVNLSAIREALSRLSSEGLVIAEPQRGFRAAPISIDDLRDLTRVRIEIEVLCIRRSIEIGDVAWEARVVSAYHSLSRTTRFPPNRQWWVLHEAFHMAICSGCDSPWLLRLRDLIFIQAERYRRLSAVQGGANRDIDAEHKELLDAVLARDAGRAAATVTNHFMLTTAILLEGMNRPGGPDAEMNVEPPDDDPGTPVEISTRRGEARP
jgi:DNA-binding GntR family transcriptional regulator